MELVRRDERYDIYDVSFEGSTVSKTILHPRRETRGHSHTNAELYVFLDAAVLEVGKSIKAVKRGDILVIAPGQFHRVRNPTARDVQFVCIWKGGRRQGR